MIQTLAEFIQNVPPGIDPVKALIFVLQNQFVVPRNPSMTTQLWILFGGSSLILILSIIAIATRYYKGVAWLFAKNSDGTIRPNAALTTQVCFMLNAAFNLISIPTYFLKKGIPSNAAFIWQMISYTPLCAAFLFITWSTILAPTTLTFLRNNRSELSKRRSRTISWIAIFTATLFQASLIAPIYYTTSSRKKTITTGWAVMLELKGVLVTGSGVRGLLLLEPAFDAFIAESKELSKWYRISVGVYCSWTILWVCFYVPSAIRLISTLRTRRHQLLRSVKSLQMLDDLVTNDDMELSKLSSSQSISISISPPPSPRSPRKPRLSHQLSQHPLVIQRNLIGRSPSPAPRPLSVDLGTIKTAPESPCSTNPLLSFTGLSPSPSYRSDLQAFPLSPPAPVYQQRSPKLTPLHRSQSSNNSLNIIGETMYQISESEASSSTLDFGKHASPKEFAERVLKNVTVVGGEVQTEEISTVGVLVEGGKRRKRIPPALSPSSIGRSSIISTGGSVTMIGISTALGAKLGYSRSQERLDESKLTLARTNRLLLTIVIQFILACVMSISYSAFGMILLSGKVPKESLQNIYVSWLGWTFVGPGIIGTIIFTIMSYIGPRASFIPAVPPASSPPPVAGANEFVPSSTVAERNHNSNPTEIVGKGRMSGIFLGVDVTTFTSISHSRSQSHNRLDDNSNSLQTSISSDNSRKKNKKLKKSNSVFSIHSLFTPQASLDAASISRKGRVESMLDVSDLDNDEIRSGVDTSNGNTNSGSEGGKKWDTSEVEERNLAGNGNGWARSNSQRWLPSDWAREEVARKVEEEG